ncbi:hypothetical protein ACFT7S_03115 [Streptomyces sp. NPDC057136]|uniref:COG4315 family predicted lipoprotein n=1 Tax=Streptomyces sp. NPDC057136 TaxID=3346029 RepID=UPI00362D3597
MPRIAKAAAVMAVIGLLTAAGSGCSDSDNGGSSPTKSATKSATKSPTASATAAGGQTVATADNPLGTILVGEDDKTVYLFESDTSIKSTCSGDCAKAWPPVLTDGKPVAGEGAKADLLGTAARGDGGTQVTYNGHPLYYFQDDVQAGDTNGQDSDAFGAKWYVLDASGDKVTKKAEPTGGGY